MSFGVGSFHGSAKRLADVWTRSGSDPVFAAQYKECGEAAVSRILHFTVTPQPSADWVAQQLREAFPEAAPYRYAILDRDPIFDANVLKASGLTPKRTSVQAPWQNGMAERWIGSWPPRDPGSRHRAE